MTAAQWWTLAVLGAVMFAMTAMVAHDVMKDRRAAAAFAAHADQAINLTGGLR